MFSIKKTVDSLDRVQILPFEDLELAEDDLCIINISTQQQFDCMLASIKKSISLGEHNIKVHITEGIYQFNEDHINFKNENYENVSIIIEGENAIVTSDNTLKKNITIAKPWEDAYWADSLILVNEGNNICFIPYKNKWSNDIKQKYKKLKIPQCYKSVDYPIVEINESGIYFKAKDLFVVENRLRKSYNVNYDYVYHGEGVRFLLYNEDSTIGCKASTFMRLANSHFKLMKIRGLIFDRNKDEGALISINNIEADQINISDCSFTNIRGTVVYFSHCDHIAFKNNIVKDIMRNGVFVSDGCIDVHITNNLFENCGQSLSNTFCIRCNEADYYIAENKFVDFGYGAIGLGLWYGEKKKAVSRGIVEYNEIYYTPSYKANYWKRTLMDSGAIYTWTQNDGIIMRYNYIHDITGMWENRGIFCDDGASNLKIYCNILLNIDNYYYIDSRSVKDNVTNYRNNENNLIAYNIVEGPICYMGYDTENRHCIKGVNFMVETGRKLSVENKICNLEIQEKDVPLKGCKALENNLIVPLKYADFLDNLLCDKYIGKIIKISRK